MSGFHPDFAAYDVVISNYNGADWPEETQEGVGRITSPAAEGWSIVPRGRQFVSGVEGVQRDDRPGRLGRPQREGSGPYVRYRDGKVVRDTSPGRGGSHGPQHPFQVVTRNAEHPIIGRPAGKLACTLPTNSTTGSAARPRT